MEDFICALYRGNYYQESYTNKERFQEYREKQKFYCEIYQAFVKGLSKEQKRALDDLDIANADVWTMEIENAFSRGVKIGFQMKAEIDKIEL